MSITQRELQAGADALKEIAEAKGFGFYFTEDNYRDIAAKVIRAYLAVRNERREEG